MVETEVLTHMQSECCDIPLHKITLIIIPEECPCHSWHSFSTSGFPYTFDTNIVISDKLLDRRCPYDLCLPCGHQTPPDGYRAAHSSCALLSEATLSFSASCMIAATSAVSSFSPGITLSTSSDVATLPPSRKQELSR